MHLKNKEKNTLISDLRKKRGCSIVSRSIGYGSLSRTNEIGRRVVASAIIGGTASELGGGKFANGAITAAFIQLYNEGEHENKSGGHKGLTKYANKNFKDRFPEGIGIIFDLTDEMSYTLSVVENPKEIEVFINKSIWSGDKRILYDAVDHELVHVADYASGLANSLSQTYEWQVVVAILEYRAYSKNINYNNQQRNSENRLNVTFYERIRDGYKKLLPNKESHLWE